MYVSGMVITRQGDSVWKHLEEKQLERARLPTDPQICTEWELMGTGNCQSSFIFTATFVNFYDIWR